MNTINRLIDLFEEHPQLLLSLFGTIALVVYIIAK